MSRTHPKDARTGGEHEDPSAVTGLQLDLLRALWRLGEATVTEVRAELSGRRKLAPTTVATLLKRLEARQLVAFRREGRSYRWRATKTEADVVQSTVDGALSAVFDGDVTAFAAQLLRREDVGSDELAQIRQLIEERERELESGPENR